MNTQRLLVLWLLPLMLMVISGRDSQARVGSISLAELIKQSDYIVLAKVVIVENIDGLRIANAIPEQDFKGSNRGQPFYYVASQLWRCDTSFAKEGETVLLFLEKAKGSVVSRGLLNLPSANVPMKPLFLITHSGRGRMPILQKVGKTYALPYQYGIIFPKGMKTKPGILINDVISEITKFASAQAPRANTVLPVSDATGLPQNPCWVSHYLRDVHLSSISTAVTIEVAEHQLSDSYTDVDRLRISLRGVKQGRLQLLNSTTYQDSIRISDLHLTVEKSSHHRLLSFVGNGGQHDHTSVYLVNPKTFQVSLLTREPIIYGTVERLSDGWIVEHCPDQYVYPKPKGFKRLKPNISEILIRKWRYNPNKQLFISGPFKWIR